MKGVDDDDELKSVPVEAHFEKLVIGLGVGRGRGWEVVERR